MALINFDTPVDSSLQVGDMLHYAPITQNVDSAHTSVKGIISKPLAAGKVAIISHQEGLVYYTPNAQLQPTIGDFILFSKPIQHDESSLKGYYADVTLVNSSNKRAELFAVSSEIALSSK